MAVKKNGLRRKKKQSVRGKRKRKRYQFHPLIENEPGRKRRVL